MTESPCCDGLSLRWSSTGSLPNWVVAIAAVAQPLCVAVIRDYMVKNKSKLIPLLPEVRVGRVCAAHCVV